jgi:hypothetical protein
LHNDKFHDWCTPPNVIRVEKIDKNKIVGVCNKCRGRVKVSTELGGGDLRGRDLLEDLDLDGRVILKLMLNRMGEREKD